MKVAVIISTNGSVLQSIWHEDYIKERISLVVSDRECGAIEFAKEHGIKNIVLRSTSGKEFSKALLRYFQSQKYDLYISFYTKLFSSDLVSYLAGRFINLHPSLLPSFKGLNGIEDAYTNSTKYIGSTIHFIDSNMDTGECIIQSIFPKDPRFDFASLRHDLFLDQCRTLIQVINWFDVGRIMFKNGNHEVKNAKYTDIRFVPNLDFDIALNFTT